MFLFYNIETGKIIRRNPKAEILEKPQEYSSLEELFSFDWISESKEDLEKISKKDYYFQIGYEDYREEYAYSLVLASKNHLTVIGWCNENEIIKTLPTYIT